MPPADIQDIMVVVSRDVTVCVIVRMVQGGIESRLAEPTAVIPVTVALVWVLTLVKFHPPAGIKLTLGLGAARAAVVVARSLTPVKLHPAEGSGLRVDVETGGDRWGCCLDALASVPKAQGRHSTVPLRSVARARSAVPLEMTAKLHAEEFLHCLLQD